MGGRPGTMLDAHERAAGHGRLERDAGRSGGSGASASPDEGNAGRARPTGCPRISTPRQSVAAAGCERAGGRLSARDRAWHRRRADQRTIALERRRTSSGGEKRELRSRRVSVGTQIALVCRARITLHRHIACRRADVSAPVREVGRRCVVGLDGGRARAWNEGSLSALTRPCSRVTRLGSERRP